MANVLHMRHPKDRTKQACDLKKRWVFTLKPGYIRPCSDCIDVVVNYNEAADEPPEEEKNRSLSMVHGQNQPEELRSLVKRLAKLMYDITEDQYREAFGVNSSSPDSLAHRFGEAASIFNELNGD